MTAKYAKSMRKTAIIQNQARSRNRRGRRAQALDWTGRDKNGYRAPAPKNDPAPEPDPWPDPPARPDEDDGRDRPWWTR